MSDYWSGIFLLITVAVAIFLLLIVLVMVLLGRRKSRFKIIALAIIFFLASTWTIDRFIVGYFCLPWECMERDIRIENLLLDNANLPDDWVIGQTFPYAYVPRASIAYVERTFHNDSKLANDDFYQEVYQYQSVRGASFQFDALKYDLPRQYFEDGEPLFSQLDLQDNHSTTYIAGCVTDARSACYYIAQYDEYVVVLRMPFTTETAPLDDFVEMIQLADQKLSNALSISDSNLRK